MGNEMSSQEEPTVYEKDPDLQRTAGIPCTVCGDDSLWTQYTCRQCKEAAYCSDACKDTDARFHKLLCTSMKYFTTPPNSSYRRAIVFDHDGEEPRFAWILVTTTDGLEGPREHLATFQIPEINPDAIDFNAVRGRILQNRIIMHVGDSWKSLGLGLNNKCIAAVVGAAKDWNAESENASTDMIWPGTYVFMVRNGFSNCSFLDATFADFRHIVDFLSLHRMADMSPPTWAGRARKIAVVRASAFEEQSIVFEQQYFPQDHPKILARFENSIREEKRLARYDIPAALNIPLCWIAGPRHGHIEVCPDHLPLIKEVDFVRCCLIPEMEDRFHSCGPHKYMDYIFFREDLIDLRKEHMMAINDFCIDKIMGLQDNNAYVSEKARKYRDVATKKAFERYWQKCKRNYGWDKKLASPYEANLQEQMEE